MAEQANITRHIAATPDNATALREFVRAWPELHALVQQLQAADLFPGLRSLQISLTGAPNLVAKGFGAPWPENAPQPRKTAAED